jgi:hypothetical protein
LAVPPAGVLGHSDPASKIVGDTKPQTAEEIKEKHRSD